MSPQNYLIIAQDPSRIDGYTYQYDINGLLINPFFHTDKGSPIDEAIAYKKYLWNILNNPGKVLVDISSFDNEKVKSNSVVWFNEQPTNDKVVSYLHKIADDIRSLFKVQLVSIQSQESNNALYQCIMYLVNSPVLSIENKLTHEDLLSIEKGLIVQNVNCQKKMGAGLALAIKNKYPQVYQEYTSKNTWELGETQFVNISDDLVFCNLAGQKYYGAEKRQTDFMAIEAGLKSVQEYALKNRLQVYIPFGFASGRAGGSSPAERKQTWTMIQGSIHRICPEAIIVFRDFN